MMRIAALCLLAIGAAAAADVKGTWNVTATSPNGREYKMALDLKEESGKLTGSMASPEGNITIENAKLEGDTLSFDLPVGGGYKISLKVAEESMKGTYNSPDGGTGPVVAERPAGAAAPSAGIAGNWQIEAKSEDGREYKLRLELAVEDGKVTGSLVSPEGAVPLTDGRIEGSNLSFKVMLDEGAYEVKLEVAGNEMTGTYSGPGGEKGKVAAKR